MFIGELVHAAGHEVNYSDGKLQTAWFNHHNSAGCGLKQFELVVHLKSSNKKLDDDIMSVVVVERLSY